MNKSVWDSTLQEILDSFIPEVECEHSTRITFAVKSGLALECPACGNVVYQEERNEK